MEYREIELTVGEAEIGRLVEPLAGRRIVGFAAIALRVHDRQIVHGLDVALFGRALVPRAGACRIGLHADPTFVETTEPVLSRSRSAARRALIPFGGLGKILGHARPWAKRDATSNSAEGSPFAAATRNDIGPI